MMATRTLDSRLEVVTLLQGGAVLCTALQHGIRFGGCLLSRASSPISNRGMMIQICTLRGVQKWIISLVKLIPKVISTQ
jgi:hypothetical protein